MILKNKKINSLIVDDWKRLIGLNTKEDADLDRITKK